MINKNTKLIYIKNILLFLFFGAVIALFTTYLNFYISYNAEEEKLKSDSEYVASKIKTYTKNYLDKIEMSIDSIQSNRLFTDYLQERDKKTKEMVYQLFINTINNNYNFFQLRFIDENGLEKLRVDRQRDSNDIFIVKDDKLQDKSKRYYFKESIKNNGGDFWYSFLDLNIENGVLEKPIRPTLRVASKVYHKGKFYGILVVNVEMHKLLSYIRENNQFNVYMIDGDGNSIVDPNIEKEWKKQNFDLSGYIFSMEEYFKNSQDIKLVLKVKEAYLRSIKSDNIDFALTLGIIILFVSIPIGFLMSIPTSKLYMELNKLYRDNLRYIDTIDKYVITMTANTDAKITEVSKALCDLSGYSKEEIIGQNISIFKSGNMDNAIYKDLWAKIKNGLVWTGELQNKKNNGEYYWLKATILPNMVDNKIENYISLGENITDKKNIEIISQTDKLTQLYNRVKLDDSLENEMHRYLRYKNVFSLIIIDMDHFKAVNDNFGHQVGDAVLVDLANILKQNCREVDIVGRWGGEEFLIICTDTDIEGASKLAEKLRVSVEAHEFKDVKHKTISVGVTAVKDSDNIEIILKRVDDYLYEAKESGRNKVISDITKL